MFDLIRAFDTVDKTFLANNLDALCNRGPINGWFVCFFENRKFGVKEDDIDR